MFKTLEEYIPELNFNNPDAIIIDIAGKDSIAAIIKYLEENTSSKPQLIPITIKAPTEYGDNKKLSNFYLHFKNTLINKFNAVIIKEFFIEDPFIWSLLNGKYVSELIKRFGFYSPCPGCHLHFHAIRGFIANRLKINKIISGERLLHNDKIKINQLKISLKKHQEILAKFNVKHIQPLRDVNYDKYIFEKLNKYNISDEMIYHFPCVYSGNYRYTDGKTNIPNNLSDFYTLLIYILETYFENIHLSNKEILKKIDNIIQNTND